MSADPELDPDTAREARIAALEERVQRRGPGVKVPVALLALLTSAILLSLQWKDMVYFFSSRVPLTLGVEGAYRYEVLASNRYVQLHGLPTARGAYGKDGDRVFVVVGMRESPFLVRRAALLPEEAWDSRRPPPQPHQAPFAVRGRLLAEEDAPHLEEAFTQLRKMGEVQPLEGRLWIVLAGEHPGGDRGLLVTTLALLGFAALNVAFLVAALRGRPAPQSP